MFLNERYATRSRNNTNQSREPIGPENYVVSA